MDIRGVGFNGFGASMVDWDAIDAEDGRPRAPRTALSGAIGAAEAVEREEALLAGMRDEVDALPGNDEDPVGALLAHMRERELAIFGRIEHERRMLEEYVRRQITSHEWEAHAGPHVRAWRAFRRWLRRAVR